MKLLGLGLGNLARSKDQLRHGCSHGQYRGGSRKRFLGLLRAVPPHFHPQAAVKAALASSALARELGSQP